MSEYTLKDRIRNDHIRERVGVVALRERVGVVAPISEKMRDYHLRWYGYVQELNELVRITEQMVREPYIRNRGDQRELLVKLFKEIC